MIKGIGLSLVLRLVTSFLSRSEISNSLRHTSVSSITKSVLVKVARAWKKPSEVVLVALTPYSTVEPIGTENIFLVFILKK